MRTYKIILIVIITFNSNMSFCQTRDSLKNPMLELLKINKTFKENIYDFIGKELPKFELMLLNGKILNSESLKGKPTLINFWFSNCAPCIEEMPLLNEIKSTFGDEVNFISITYQNLNEVSEFLKKFDFNFMHLVNSKEYLKQFGTFGYPKTLILDKNLVITEIEKMIPKDVLKEKQNKEEFKNRISNQLKQLKNR